MQPAAKIYEETKNYQTYLAAKNNDLEAKKEHAILLCLIVHF